MEKEQLLKELADLLEKEGCYQEVMEVANYGWNKYKQHIDESLAAINALAYKLISPKKAKELLESEHKEGNLNLTLFPYFRETIIKITKK